MKVGESRLIEESGDTTIKSTNGTEVFIGVSTTFSDEQSALNDAVLDGRKQILQSLEINISAEQNVERLFIEDQTGIIESRELFDSKTLSVSKGILSVKPESFYLEKWERQVSKKEIEYEYKAWCLIRYSSSEHEQIVTAMVTSMLDAANPILSRAETERQQGQVSEALRTAFQVNELISDMTDYPAIPVQLKTQINSVQDRLAKLVGSIKLLVAIYERVAGERNYSLQFQPRLIEALAQHKTMSLQSSIDWSLTNADALLTDPALQKSVAQEHGVDFILAGIAEIQKINDSKAKYGIYSASLRVQLKLIDPTSNRIIWENTIPGELIGDIRDFASNENDAAMKVLSMSKRCKDKKEENPYQLLSRNILDSFIK